MNFVTIILCGILASGYYKELFYAIIPIYALFWILEYKYPVRYSSMLVTVA